MTDPIIMPKPVIAGIERRLFLRQTLSLGALTLLTGFDVSDNDAVQRVLGLMSRWNDRAQAFRRGDGLESGDSGADHQNRCRPDCARGSGQHGHESFQSVGRDERSLVAGHRALRGQRIH